LQVDYNQLVNLDISQNNTLTILTCSNNQLTNLDISNNIALTEFNCHNNQLTNLNVTQNTALSWLMFSYNLISSIDVSNNIALTEMWCGNNYLTSIDISSNTALTNLSCQFNQLTLLELSQNILLEILHCSHNQLIVLDVSGQHFLNDFFCSYNDLTELNVKNGNNVNFEFFDASQNINLYCINVDDTTWSNSNWSSSIDPQHYFSFNCPFWISPSWNCINNICIDPGDGSGNFIDSTLCISSCVQTEISNQLNNHKLELIRIIDVLGRETQGTKNEVLFYIYDDGTMKKKIIVE
jgi:hypothetical protein